MNQAHSTFLTVFLGTFLVKKNVGIKRIKRWYKIKKFKRQIVAYEILNVFC
jgi:hypothetical protein